MSKLPYSYHTFIYPFMFDGKNPFDPSEKWQMVRFKDGDSDQNGENTPDEKENRERRLAYALYQYVIPGVRDILFTDGEAGYAKHYRYLMESTKEYFIRFVKEDRNGNYTLPIKGIKLMYFPDLKVGVFSLECENQDYESMEEINRINDIGRRLFPPFYSVDPKSGNEVPENVFCEINLEEKGIEKDEIKQIIHINTTDETTKRMHRSAVLIESIVGCQKGTLSPILDERMYVVCLIRKDDYAPIRSIRETYKKTRIYKKEEDVPGNDGGYCYEDPVRFREKAEELYKAVFLENDCTCQNERMLQEKLHSQIYARWIDYGTVHGITEYSMVCITGEDKGRENDTINPFLTIYTEMVRLALAQRAGITVLERDITELSKSLYTDQKAIGSADMDSTDQEAAEMPKDPVRSKEKCIRDIDDLWKKYAVFQAELYIPEFTFQEQGVEIYDILKRSLRLERLNEYFREELNTIHRVAEAIRSEIEDAKEKEAIEKEKLKEEEEKRKEKEREERQDRMNTAINLIAVAGTTIGLAALAQDFITGHDCLSENSLKGYIVGFLLFTVINIIALFIIALMGRKKKESTEKKSEGKQKEKKGRKTKFTAIYWIILLIIWLLVLAVVLYMWDPDYLWKAVYFFV